MKRAAILLAFAMLLSLPTWSHAATEQDFKVETTQQLINLCTAPQSDRLYHQAVNFCQGFLVGAYKYNEALQSGPKAVKLICLTGTPPTRIEAIQMFIDWAKAHPEYMQEKPVETEFRFMTETWPCTP